MVEWRFETVYRRDTDTSHRGYHRFSDSHNRNQRHAPCNRLLVWNGYHNWAVIRDFERSLRRCLPVTNLRRRSYCPIYLSGHGDKEGA